MRCARVEVKAALWLSREVDRLHDLPWTAQTQGQIAAASTSWFVRRCFPGGSLGLAGAAWRMFPDLRTMTIAEVG